MNYVQSVFVLMRKPLLTALMLIALIVSLISASLPAYASSVSGPAYFRIQQTTNGDDAVFNNGFVIPTVSKKNTEKNVSRTYKVDVTAYTSTVDECDASPFITADGSVVRDGIIAANFLPIGTMIRIPAYFGDRVFEVRDRMNERYWYRIDIWMSDQKAMRTWGIKRNVAIEIVEMGDGKKNWDQWKGRAKDLYRIGKYGPDKKQEQEDETVNG